MNVIYLTTAMRDKDFALLSKLAVNKPNPAGQNFHEKLIAAISTVDNINVYSIVPSNEHIIYEGNFESKSPIDFRYFEAPKNKLKRLFGFHKKIEEVIMEAYNPQFTPRTVIVYDSLNVTMSKVSMVLSKKLSIPRVAILTDNPKNISGTSNTYARLVKKYSQHANAYFALSNTLVDYFNPDQNNVYITEGVAEPLPNSLPLYNKPYIYFGGALYAKYGLAALLGAFDFLKTNFDLLIAGHGPFEKEIILAAKKNPRIVFLGQVDKLTNYNYEKHSLLNINPRYYTENLDKNSIPSKMIEYLASGRPIISTRQTRLESMYGNNINWISGKGSLLDIRSFFLDHLDKEGNLTKIAPNNASEDVLARYGYKATGQAFHTLFTHLVK